MLISSNHTTTLILSVVPQYVINDGLILKACEDHRILTYVMTDKILTIYPVDMICNILKYNVRI